MQSLAVSGRADGARATGSTNVPHILEPGYPAYRARLEETANRRTARSPTNRISGDRSPEIQDTHEEAERAGIMQDVQLDHPGVGNMDGKPDDADLDEPEEYAAPSDDLRHSLAFIDGLNSATHANGPLDEDMVERLRNHIDNADILYSLQIYMVLQNEPQGTYTAIREVLNSRYPQDKMLSLYEVEKKIAELTSTVG
ncbi:uncharacterized protein B0H18DRAFT_1209640 [Fomitopsis serialis]|uniref:uncharacterized protein n=1 Tax=Fomitopsis serialis TaxID=139415 RepID=UPI00200854BF|nr:uncharacterized protein B0H18DRAFT_1209640 [Neoantrodia serialis]KAH9930157.1 hypothetical protein B0H18DRAFT_1209640 [Neoantrodia serialis]